MACAPEVFGITENIGIAIGIAALFVMLSAAFGLFTYSGFMSKRFAFLKKEPFKLDDGVEGILNERRERSEKHCIFCITIGMCLCILSPLPSLVMSLFMSNSFVSALMAGVALLVAGVGVSHIAAGSVRRASILKLVNGQKISFLQKLNIGFNTNSKQKAPLRSRIKSFFTVLYWAIVTFIYVF